MASVVDSVSRGEGTVIVVRYGRPVAALVSLSSLSAEEQRALRRLAR